MSEQGTYPPLMSPRSPSYERAREERLHPSPVGESQIVAVLAELVEAEENARCACAKAAEALKDPALAKHAREEAATHQAHREALGVHIEALGGSAPSAAACREILSHGADSVGRAISDLGIHETLTLMRTELRAAYEEAIASSSLDETRRRALAALVPG